MVAQPLKDFLNPAFVKATAKELAATGFVSDEHDFAPYRETLNTHFAEIEKALRKAGHPVSLLYGFVKHSEAGYAFFIYDTDRFPDPKAAERAVTAWLDKRYS